jgi:hypothetical protein
VIWAGLILIEIGISGGLMGHDNKPYVTENISDNL